MALKITSPAFAHQAEIPRRFTCEGQNLSPPLEWSGVPDGTRSLALIVDDPDAPDPEAPLMVFTHWTLYGLPPETRQLPEAAGAALPKGTHEGLNDTKSRHKYGGPCPPIGRHRYFFKLFALDVELPQLAKPTRAALEKAMQGHVLEQAELIGTYKKVS